MEERNNALRGQVIGIGGIFLSSEAPEETVAWYRDVLGMTPNDYGGFDFLHSASAAQFPVAARTILSSFKSPVEYFQPSSLPFMLNLMVDDLDAVLARAAGAGCEPVQPRENTDYGDFAWLMDPEGRKIELWEPKEPE
jgi:predicted enzyme related to lactoylglutathione lyase